MLEQLAISPLSDAPYDRDDWPHWRDADGDCQSTRVEVLIEEAIAPVTLTADGCTVVAGAWRDYFTGVTITDPSSLDIDHMVPLANANAAGGATWPAEKKRDYANSLDNPHALVAVRASANRSKGSRTPDEWKPPDTASWCWYAGAWISVKAQWHLTITLHEKNALVGMLATC